MILNKLNHKQVGERMTIGERIVQERNKLNLSQKALAEEIGIAQGLLSRIENDNKMPPIQLIYQMAKIFEITPSELFKGVN